MSKAFTLATLATSDLATQTDLASYATSSELTTAIDGIVIPEGGISNLTSTTLNTQTWTGVSGNSVQNEDHTSNLAVGKYLVHIRTRGSSNSDTNGMQVSAYPTSNHVGITMYSMGDDFGGGRGTRATVSGRYELWDVTSATNSFRSNHANVSMWSSGHQSIQTLSGSVTAMRIT